MSIKVAHDNWHTNPEGVIPPLFGHHPEFHHIETARVSPFREGKFREATKTEQFPEGISHQEFHDTLMHMHILGHGGQGWHGGQTDPHHIENHLVHHPFVKNVQQFASDSGVHPIDFHEDNVGTWTHPHTGKLHPVLLDYGYRNDIARDYTEMHRKYKKANPEE